MKPIEVTDEAEEDLAAAAIWYEEQAVGLGVDFVIKAREAIQRVAVAPLLYPRVHGETRRAGVKRFPYGVFYRVVDFQIVVVAIFHDRLDPTLWQLR
ncbi:type II toxin-antitoxin system RelE/ParE family toxin [Anatilimnocola floriformis]|uniref:type II toxin-antitoxin system RelE/ParE family toxin n=1 Tax=Anatilimnocola floriformis TaxID=2948575 RepID=UPI0020C55157|nr:type II toxin-antitoxin system RelE/ParE family toxin [Anatilimnocola floriformis]